jgi:large subunit ribosomal protein L9
MDIILLERVEKLGQMGDVVRVKDGFARNFLLPRKKALRATEANRKRFENDRADLELHNLQLKSEAEQIAKRMAGVSVIVVRQAGDTGQLYGSVSNRDVSEALIEAGYKVDRRQVVLDTPIKTLGVHAVRVNLHPEVAIMVGVNVARSAAEAQAQASSGVAFVDKDLAVVEDEDADAVD